MYVLLTRRNKLACPRMCLIWRISGSAGRRMEWRERREHRRQRQRRGGGWTDGRMADAGGREFFPGDEHRPRRPALSAQTAPLIHLSYPFASVYPAGRKCIITTPELFRPPDFNQCRRLCCAASSVPFIDAIFLLIRITGPIPSVFTLSLD